MKHPLAWIALCFLTASVCAAADHRGRVRFGEAPIPGASVRAEQGPTVLRTLTDRDGSYVFSSLSDGNWTIQVVMSGFEPLRQEISVSRESQPTEWDLKMLPVADMQSGKAPGFSASSALPTLQTTTAQPDVAERLLINGSVNNGASTPFALANAFGNNRRGLRSLYTTTATLAGNSSVWDARPFSLTGQNTPKPDYNRFQGGVTFGGPFQIPGLYRGGSFTLAYNRTQNRNASLQTVQVPTAAQRAGDFSQERTALRDPLTGRPFEGNVIPADRISPQAKTMLDLYPQPNFDSTARYNYQTSLVGVTHADVLRGQINNLTVTPADRLSGGGAFSSTRSDSPDLFGFTDTGKNTNVSANVAWTHRFSPRISGNFQYAFTRTVSENLPYFAHRRDVSAEAGIAGNDRDPRNWGPPSLTFAGGIARLSSGSYAFDRNQSSTVSYSSNWTHGRHAFGWGADYRRQQFNLLSQQNSRGGFTFTGSATGNDFADFLLSTPDAASVALGNADKYFRQSFTNGFFTDDWRVNASITLNLGVRWEYESPITEKYGRLVNLEIAPGFASATAKVAGTSDEPLVNADRGGFQPRLGFAWRPRAGSSLVIRAAYGLYRETTVYRAIADQMAQQSPLSKSLSVQNTPDHPLTLADGLRGAPGATSPTFAVDRNFRPGKAHNWNLIIQQDLPAAMQMTLTYLGVKGSHSPQRFLPNTYAPGGVNPCPACPAGFVYLTSTGNTNRHSATVEVRRRQRNGFEASARYTLAKAIDDAGIGSPYIAQNWLDLRAERGLSSFDQRHQLVVQGQYTTGLLAGVGVFGDGWRGKILREWTVTGQLTVGSGSPLTPVILVPVPGTAFTGSLRPDLTGAPIYLESGGAFLNPAAFAAPSPGAWGNAGRNTITGPGQFSLNAGITRTFRVNERISMDLRVDATNALNHVTFPRWNTTLKSAQFGLPTQANPMRTLQPSLRLRF